MHASPDLAPATTMDSDVEGRAGTMDSASDDPVRPSQRARGRGKHRSKERDGKSMIRVAPAGVRGTEGLGWTKKKG